MNHIHLFEKFNIVSHLKKRGIDVNKTRVLIDEKTDDVYFFLYNFSGQMVGYQKYNPHYKKVGQNNLDDPRLTKYFNWVSEEGYGRKIAAWGIESLKFTDKYIFVTEGIFDIARIHECGYPGIAALCNNPSDSFKSWLATLPQKKIVIYDNDKAGKKLIPLGDYAFSVDGHKDINDLSVDEAKIFIDSCIKKIESN